MSECKRVVKRTSNVNCLILLITLIPRVLFQVLSLHTALCVPVDSNYILVDEAFVK